MPLRENGGDCIAQRFLRHVVKPNNADVFIWTDTNDFYFNGVQYYPEDRKIEILNNDSCRIYDKVAFIKKEEAKEIIERELRSLLGENLKALMVEFPYDPKIDPRYKFLHDANVIGSSPSLLIHQWRKLKLAYEMLTASGVPYDVIMKWRFDIFIPDGPLAMGNYDFHNVDMYIAGGEPPIVYDWYAFGKKHAIEEYMNLYDNLGCFLSEGRAFMCECKRCNGRSHYGPQDNKPCSRCGHPDLHRYEITLAPEYHLFRLHQIKGLRTRGSGYGAHPYRYNDPGTRKPINDVIKNLGVGPVTLVNHTASRDSSVTKYGE